MSSFKRRVQPGSNSAALPLSAGVKPSSFSSPVPLVSTGVPALDDLLSGGGLASGCDLLLLPASGTASSSAAVAGASTTPSAAAETDHAARALAEPYLDLLLGYSVAQGLASSHTAVVIGEDTAGFTAGLMARAGDLDDQLLAQLGPATTAAPTEAPSDHLDTVVDDDDAPVKGQSSTSQGGEEADNAQREREMKIAWRYHSMRQFNTTVNEPGSSTEAAPFCQTFDLSRRIDARLLQHAASQRRLETLDVADEAQGGGSSYEAAFARIQAAAQRCREQQLSAPSSAPPVLRIAVRSLGSPSWTVARGQTPQSEAVRFLHRLRRLLRSLALVDATARQAAIPAIAVVSISSVLLAGAGGGNVVHRMVHSVDAAVTLSAFASSTALRRAFAAYTGAFKVLKTPAVGTLTNPSVRSSVLRGMGSGTASGAGGLAGAGEGGAGGGENNLAFKVRRKRLVIETLHLDVEGGVSERRTKPPRADAEAAPRRTLQTSKAEPQPPSQPGTSQGSEAPAPPKAKLTGLAALRQRGLAAAASRSDELAVQVDASTGRSHSHARPGTQRRVTPPLSKAADARPQDLEF